MASLLYFTHLLGLCYPKDVFFLCLPDKERTKESAPRANHTLHFALYFVVSASKDSALTPHMLRAWQGDPLTPHGARDHAMEEKASLTFLTLEMLRDSGASS